MGNVLGMAVFSSQRLQRAFTVSIFWAHCEVFVVVIVVLVAEVV